MQLLDGLSVYAQLLERSTAHVSVLVCVKGGLYQQLEWGYGPRGLICPGTSNWEDQGSRGQLLRRLSV